MSAFNKVIAQPSSLQARRELAAEWTKVAHPQARLLSLAMAEHDGLPRLEAKAADREMDHLIDAHGREWAGEFLALFERYEYRLGLIAEIGIRGDVLVEHGARIFAHFPIQHLGLREPMCLEQVFAMPQLQQISTLFLTGDSGDPEAALMAACPYLTNLRIGALGDRITAVGMQALAMAPSLTNVIALDVTNNPGAHSSVRGHLFTKQINDSNYLLGQAAVPYYNEALDAAAKGYNCETPDWPPSYVDVAWTD
jgi:hypothetical protein